MSNVSAFTPKGATSLVDATARQISESGGGFTISVRVRNLATTTQYFTWGSDNTVTSVGAPVGGTPSANTIGMIGSSVEVFTLDYKVALWMIASSATGFEATPGEGL